MKQILKAVLLLQLLAVLTACVTPENTGGRPAWIDNPGNGVSASAGFHVGGRVAQEELAVLRGRTAYAKGMGVSIQSEQISSMLATNSNFSSVSRQDTREDTKQVDVKVVIKEKWHDRVNDVLWVWLVPPTDK
jgi:hypothetical protein